MKRLSPLLFALAACGPPVPPPVAPKSAAVVAKEGDLLTVTITPEAEARLGVRTEVVELRKLARSRLHAGEAIVPPGRTVVVSALLAGLLTGDSPGPRTKVERDEIVFTLTPFVFLTPEARASLAASQADAEGEVASTAVELAAATVALERAEGLLRDKAGSQRAVDDATTRRDAAQAGLSAAEARRLVLEVARDGVQESIDVKAPFAGVLSRLHVAPGQYVPAGAPLFDIEDLSRLWVRVPVYVGDLKRVDAQEDIVIEGFPAKPVEAPPSADMKSSTADLVYEVENGDGALRPGQRVMVEIPLRAEEESLGVPWSAIVHDIQGDTWIYEELTPQKYARRRVQVRQLTGDWAVLASGPPAGTKVVVAGAAELYGTEFGHAR